jgi:TP901 family phage tail tape measure protein
MLSLKFSQMATQTTQWILELKDNVTAPMKSINGASSSALSSVNKLQLGSTKAMDAISSQVPSASSALGLLTNPYLLATAGAAALGTEVYKSINMAEDWREGMAKINVTAQLTQKELKGVSDNLRDIGERNVAPIEQIPEAFNKIISAGLDVNTSMKVLEPTLKAAKAGFTDVGETGKAAVAVMNSSGEDINKVYDILFATLNKGNAEFADIAQYLPKLIPMARNAGFALNETAGAWAYLTAQGMSSERATTVAQNAMKAMSDPDRIKGFKEMGVNLYDAQGKIKPLTSIIEQLSLKTKGLSDLSRANFFKNIGMDQEAASFFASATQDAGKFKDTIDFVVKSQGSLNQAYEDSMTPLDHWHQIINLIKGKMMDLGEKFLPIINMIGQKILDVIQYFQDLYANSSLFRDLIDGIGSAISNAWQGVKLIFSLIGSAFEMFGKVSAFVIEKVFGVSGGIEGLYRKVKPIMIYLKELFLEVGGIMAKVLTFDFKGAVEMAKNFKLPDLNVIQKKVDEDNKKADNKDKPTNVIALPGVSPKLKNTDFSKSTATSLGGKSGSSIKNISQRIEIKNYFTIEKGASKTDIDETASKVVRAINDKLRDGMIAEAS